MRLVKVKGYEEMSAFAAGRILEKIKGSQEVTLGLATGGTPVRMYELLVQDYKRNQTSYRHVFTYNLDEYAGIPSDHPNSYYQFMFQHFFNHVNIPKENIHIPQGLTTDLHQEAKRYEKLIDKISGVDLQILGIGENGHIGFNEPGTPFTKETHVIELTESTRQANARYFDHEDEVPTHAITMGIATILKSKEILLLASGDKKAEAIYQMFSKDHDVECPASALKTHPNVLVIADEKAAARLESWMSIKSP
ncbi:glucosamine-6-phosphate deaminase [Peribacillus deserti]|uniref:Glucosamine-6-phosphate deaminase n=1 Tax=Peribacillus deserti TaxID=673318 RepID=A0A2N5M690_9BACI|nr:glucosamine-6-phosphate deaminase [Peribacillus deserti]PLT29867.1 glucosamine-6-phosphate deaminase [Peribacillus deserti]